MQRKKRAQEDTERLAAEKAAEQDAERQAAEAEAERLAQEESERLAQEQAEREEAEAETERLAAEQEGGEAAEPLALKPPNRTLRLALKNLQAPRRTSRPKPNPWKKPQPRRTTGTLWRAQRHPVPTDQVPVRRGGDGSGPSGEPEIASADTLSGSAGPGGPISQQACTALGAPDHCPEVNAALARITEKPARFDLPSEMSFGDTASIDMAFLNNLQAGDLPGDLAGFVNDLPENAKQALEKLASTFTIKLTSDGFDVSPEGPQTLNADAGNLAGLNWQLTPSKGGGDQSVKIQLFASAPGGQGGTSEVLIKTFDSVIKVHLSTWDWIKIFINAYLPYFLIIGALLLAMISLLVFPRKGRDGEPGQTAFANAGAGSDAPAASEYDDAAPVRNSGPVIGDLDQSASDGPSKGHTARQSGSSETSAAGMAIGATTAAAIVAGLDGDEGGARRGNV